MHNPADGTPITERLRDAWSRRKWLALAAFAVAAAVGVTLVTSLPNVYRATATVLVEEPRVEAAVAAELDRRLQMISQEILSRARLEAIIHRFSLYPRMRSWASADELVARMRRDVHTRFQASTLATGAGGTLTVAVGYRGTDPVTVAGVANALADLYVEEDRRLRAQRASGTVQVLEAQLQELKQTLAAQESEVASFQERHVGELPQQSDANLAALEQLHADLRAVSEERMRALDRRNELLRRLSELEAEGAPAAPAARAQSRLEKLQDELRDLRRRYSDRYPDVVRVKAEIAALADDPAAAEAPAEAPPPPDRSGAGARLKDSLAEVERQVEAFRADEARLRAGVSGYIQRLENVPRRQRALQEISRDYESTRELYDSLRKRYEQALLEEGTQATAGGPRFRILDAALVPTGPAAPNRMLLLAFALLAALGAAAGAALAAEQMDTSFKSADEVRAFAGVPVLVTIPRMDGAADRRSRRFRFCAAALAVVLGAGALAYASREFARDNDALVAIVARGRS